MDNVIYTDYDECIGYYADLVKVLKDTLNDLVKENRYEEAEGVIGELQELDELKEYHGLIILSENNGMGFTARKYSEKEQE